MKNVTELLAIVKDICPEIKASESLFIVDLIITERDRAYKDGANRALYLADPDYDEIKEEYDSEEAQERIEDKEHYGDYSDQREGE